MARREYPSVVKSDWPALPYTDWSETLATLHRWFQVVGKVRMSLTPWVNHSWSASLYPTVRGLTTSPMPYGPRDLQIDFNFLDHSLVISTSDGESWKTGLRSGTVAEFYRELFAALGRFGCDVEIYPAPNEVPDPIPFTEDTAYAAYEPAHAGALWEALRHSARVMFEFRAQFIGKVSPVHFFWGAPDLAVTRFSGREAPPHPGGIPHLPDEITREAYSHEVASCGFWPGSADSPQPVFYAYSYPTPQGYADSAVKPTEAFWHKDLGEFMLPYEAVRASESPDETLHQFFQSTYEAGADLADWDRKKLERPRGYRPLEG